MRTEQKLDIKELIFYEMPKWCEYVSNEFFQGLVARWISLKVNRKLRRYYARMVIKKKIENYLKSNL